MYFVDVHRLSWNNEYISSRHQLRNLYNYTMIFSSGSVITQIPALHTMSQSILILVSVVLLIFDQLVLCKEYALQDNHGYIIILSNHFFF